MLSRVESVIASDGALRVSLCEHAVPELGPDQVLIRVEATPANPSDMSLMLGPAALDTLRVEQGKAGPILTGTIPPERLEALASRLDQSIPIGNEGAGTIVAAGRNVADMFGRKCSGLLRGGMFGTLRVAELKEVMILPDDIDTAEAAAMYINPLTVLAMTETMRRGGHHAIVHTAAASNLGQMLVRVCAEDGIPLVNIVRRPEQVDLLRDIGATHVLNSTSADFDAALETALHQTGATILFDALGGGTMADRILRAMEKVATAGVKGLSRYGSDIHKSAYIYSALSDGPSALGRTYGQSWNISPFFLPHVLSKFGAQVQQQMEERVLNGVRSTFASQYAGTIGLTDILDLDVIRKVTRRATNAKYLILPNG